MTDKIIIDGVDVSKCPYGANQFCSLCEDSYYEWWDCEFKQLQRKTAECEELKQALDEIEKMTQKDLCLNCEYYCEYCDYRYILDIIKRTGEPRRQKAKDGE